MALPVLLTPETADVPIVLTLFDIDELTADTPLESEPPVPPIREIETTAFEDAPLRRGALIVLAPLAKVPGAGAGNRVGEGK